jgi:protease-4
MTDTEKKMIQTEIDLIYSTFKQRVADGRKKDTAYIETIAQGRVWTGTRAKEIGLIDRFGGIQDAVRSAASMAKLTEYKVREYPEPDNIFETLFGKNEQEVKAQKIKEEMGIENYSLYLELKKVKELAGTPQARLPFTFSVN